MLKTELFNGPKNLKVIIRGILEEELKKTLILKDLPKAKLAAAIWLIQEKLGLTLWWSKEELIMPMESRNSVRLDRGWEPPKDWKGELFMSSFGFDNGPKPKHFVIELDFDK